MTLYKQLTNNNKLIKTSCDFIQETNKQQQIN